MSEDIALSSGDTRITIAPLGAELRSLQAGKMGYSTAQVGDLVAAAVSGD